MSENSDGDDINLSDLHSLLVTLRTSNLKTKNESIRDFAKAARISATYVAQMEGRAGKKNAAPTVVMLHRYLKHCGKTLTWLFSELENEKPGGLTTTQSQLLDSIRRILITGNRETEELVRDRIEDIRARIVVQNIQVKSKKHQKRETG